MVGGSSGCQPATAGLESSGFSRRLDAGKGPLVGEMSVERRVNCCNAGIRSCRQ